jgi:ubiquinone/menaquinone biosynthesis C-methylase UbiE
MTNLTSAASPTSNSWNTYWQGTSSSGAFSSGGATHPAVHGFWAGFFDGVNKNYQHPRILDIASGNGAVVASALAVLKDKKCEITALDASAAAIENISGRFPAVKGIVSDARFIPRETASFDIVTSQFGVEYAGYEAITEAARMLADGGQLALLLHIESGSIYQECQQSLDAIKRLRTCQFIKLATQMFDAGFEALQGVKSTAYVNAVKQYAPAVRELEAIMKQYGHRIASDTISGLYNDVRQMHQRIQHYEPDEVFNWLKNMDIELDAYSERMASMLSSSVDTPSFKRISDDLIGLGLSIELADTFFVTDVELPLAWILVAKKMAANNSDIV